MSFKPEFLIEGKWCDNAVRFATKEEAEANAADKFSRWTVPADYRATESPDPVNYKWVDGALEAVK
jgi:hypothetical protein